MALMQKLASAQLLQKLSQEPKSNVLCANVGDMVLVPCIVHETQEGSRRLVPAENVACLQLTSQTGDLHAGHVDPAAVYNPNSRLPSSLMHKIAVSASLESMIKDLEDLGHSRRSAVCSSMAFPWIRDHVCFVDSLESARIAETVVQANNSALNLSLSFTPQQQWAETLKRKEQMKSESYNKWLTFTMNSKPQNGTLEFDLDLAPIQLPSVVVASQI